MVVETSPFASAVNVPTRNTVLWKSIVPVEDGANPDAFTPTGSPDFAFDELTPFATVVVVERTVVVTLTTVVLVLVVDVDVDEVLEGVVVAHVVVPLGHTWNGFTAWSPY